MKRKIVALTILLAIAGVWLMNGCKKDPASNEPLEPISLIEPDTAIVHLFAGDTMPIQIKFTTDRPLNWVRGLYDVDTAGLANYSPTFPDTIFFQHLDTLDPRVNIYTYTGVYRIPDTLRAFSVVYLDASFEAGKAGFVSGQNYPAGVVTGEKRFKINVR